MRGCSPSTSVSTGWGGGGGGVFGGGGASILGDGAVPPKEDVYLCDSEVACMLKVSRRTLGEYRSNGTLPYYVLGGKVLYKRSEIEQVLERECRSVGNALGSG
mgnify:CR=1 FL=1